MATTTTPLGFQKPGGGEAVRNGDNVISANADKAEQRIQEDRGRLTTIESKNAAQDTRLTSVETKNTQQDGRLTAAETAAATLSGRVTTTETKNTAQDGRLTTVEGKVTTLNTEQIVQNGRIAQVENAAGFGNPPLEMSDEVVAALVADTGSVTRGGLDTRYANAAINDAADPVAYLDSIDILCTWDTRPAGSEATYPQGVSINEAAGEIYVANQGGTLLRIDVRNMDGTLKSSKSITTANGAYTEGLPYWFNGNNELCFMIRTGVSATEATYNIYNYTLGTLGPQIPILGVWRATAQGNVLITTDARTNTIANFFVYDWASVKAGTPTLLRTIPVEYSGATVAKNQGLVLNDGHLFLTQGAAATFPTITVYDLAGRVRSAHQVSREAFAAALNEARPGTVTNLAGYTYENEAGCVYRGRLVTMDVINDTADIVTSKTVLTIHNVIGGAKMPTELAPYVYDTGWLTLAQIGASLAAPVIVYAADTEPLIRRIGNRVMFEGAVKGLPAAPANVVVTTLPAEWRPTRHVPAVPIQQSSSKSLAAWGVRSTGVVSMNSTTHATASETSWYPFQLTWIIG